MSQATGTAQTNPQWTHDLEITRLLDLLETRQLPTSYKLTPRHRLELERRLQANPDKLRAVWMMENTGGEPCLLALDQNTQKYQILDCSQETPKGRRSLCYDPQALADRTKFPPKDSAVGMALEMGVEILNQDDYFWLQEFGSFDLKTSSWIHTPKDIRDLGGALFADKRYGKTFVYHNGAESYYASRGFRAKIEV